MEIRIKNKIKMKRRGLDSEPKNEINHYFSSEIIKDHRTRVSVS